MNKDEIIDDLRSVLDNAPSDFGIDTALDRSWFDSLNRLSVLALVDEIAGRDGSPRLEMRELERMKTVGEIVSFILGAKN